MRQMKISARSAIAVVGVLGMLSAGLPAAASEGYYCSPWPEVETSFCMSYEGLLTSAVASAPLPLDLSMANESPQVATNSGVWLDQIEITPIAVGTAVPKLTRSSSLPPGLVIASGGSCSYPFESCAAFGSFRAYITGTGGFFDGIRSGKFGITRVTNVNPPAEGMHADYEADLTFCFDEHPSFCSSGATSLQSQEGAGDAGATSLQIPAKYVFFFNTGIGTATADGSLETLTVHLKGESDTIANGVGQEPADRTYRVFSTPNRCGEGISGGHFTARDGRFVSMGQALDVVGCPTARFSIDADGFAVDLNGAASSSPLDGRSVAKWIWSFGDGERETTTDPTVRHRYTEYGNHTVTLTTVDSEGARSTPVDKVVKGTTIGVTIDKSADSVRTFGAVNPDHDGKTVIVTLLRHRDGEYREVDTKRPALSDTSRYSTKFDRPREGRCRVEVAFPGDGDHLGSRSAENFSC